MLFRSSSSSFTRSRLFQQPLTPLAHKCPLQVSAYPQLSAKIPFPLITNFDKPCTECHNHHKSDYILISVFNNNTKRRTTAASFCSLYRDTISKLSKTLPSPCPRRCLTQRLNPSSAKPIVKTSRLDPYVFTTGNSCSPLSYSTTDIPNPYIFN